MKQNNRHNNNVNTFWRYQGRDIAGKLRCPSSLTSRRAFRPAATTTITKNGISNRNKKHQHGHKHHIKYQEGNHKKEEASSEYRGRDIGNITSCLRCDCKQHHNNDKNNNSNRKIIKRTAKATIAAHLALLLLLQAKKKNKKRDLACIPRSRPCRHRCSARPAHQDHDQISTVRAVESNNTTTTTTTTRAATRLKTTTAKTIIAVGLLFRLLHATDDK